MNIKPNISNFEIKKSRVLDILKKRAVPCSDTQIFKLLDPHELVLAEINVVLKYLVRYKEIDCKNSDSVNKTKLYFILN